MIEFITLERQSDGTWTAICWDGLLRQMSSANSKGRHVAYIEAISEAKPVNNTQELNKLEYGPVHENGWRKEGVWMNDGDIGDDTVGDFWTAIYAKPGTQWRATLTYYVVEHENSTGEPDFGVEYASSVWREVNDEQEDLDSDYDYGDARAFTTLEDAAEVAKRLAMQDEAYIYLV